ncbi:MAG TPA: ubiquinone/menaquinone biosynthesis methyltransferase [Candidatus Polarisedimenticolaceae bacterium]|nr:ubiquinone/menaquinone biosynthesis methyltransferase [Candidatus Polarisedimenticolaceae bacterium]
MQERRDPATIRAMFDGVARRYDLLNHLLSANQDRRWRRRVVRRLAEAPGAEVLDLCTGTGDLAIELLRADPARRVVGCDFSSEMLRRARTKLDRASGLSSRCALVEADALALPFAEAAFDAVTVAFGVRNLADMGAGFAEMRRVLRPGGRMFVLEFSRPEAGMWCRLYRWYLARVLPRLGDGIAGRRGPYGYLARTIAAFPDPPALAGAIRDSGFAACGWETLGGGIVALHTAYRG